MKIYPTARYVVRLCARLFMRLLHFLMPKVSIRRVGNMTHDGLMKGLKALLAVVELHTPGVGQPYCLRCDVAYPCATIYAIEKELR